MFLIIILENWVILKSNCGEFLNINKKDYNKMYGLLLGDYIEDKSKKKTHLTIVKD